jgi:hypothetical protein
MCFWNGVHLVVETTGLPVVRAVCSTRQSTVNEGTAGSTRRWTTNERAACSTKQTSQHQWTSCVPNQSDIAPPMNELHAQSNAAPPMNEVCPQPNRHCTTNERALSQTKPTSQHQLTSCMFNQTDTPPPINELCAPSWQCRKNNISFPSDTTNQDTPVIQFVYWSLQWLSYPAHITLFGTGCCILETKYLYCKPSFICSFFI